MKTTQQNDIEFRTACRAVSRNVSAVVKTFTPETIKTLAEMQEEVEKLTYNLNELKFATAHKIRTLLQK